MYAVTTDVVAINIWEGYRGTRIGLIAEKFNDLNWYKKNIQGGKEKRGKEDKKAKRVKEYLFQYLFSRSATKDVFTLVEVSPYSLSFNATNQIIDDKNSLSLVLICMNLN